MIALIDSKRFKRDIYSSTKQKNNGGNVCKFDSLAVHVHDTCYFESLISYNHFRTVNEER